MAVQVQGYAPWLGASGFVDMERIAPMTTSTRVRIASVSKIFTAVVVLQLVEAGKLNLDATLATYLPALVPQADQITLRQLLNHTSGLYDYLEDRAFFTPAYKLPDRIWQPSELVAHAAKYPLAFAPGAAGSWDYSSTNYVILGMVVEAVTGRTLAVEMRQRILDPLGLTETYFVPDEAVLGTQARGYKEAEDRTNINLSFAFATANLVATPRDMQRFAAGLFTSTLLRPESQAAMQTWVNGKGSYNMPELEYGLGLMRNRLPVAPAPDNGPRPESLSTVLGHIGGFGGFRSALWYAPDGGTTIALAINQSDNDPNVLATALLEVVLSSQGR